MSYTVTRYANHPVSATISSLYPYSVGAFSFTKPSCVQGESPCVITIAFTPTSSASYGGSVTLTGTAGVGPNGNPVITTANVYGTGGIGMASFSPPPVTFVARPAGSTSIAQNITLKNTGDGTLVVYTPTLTGANASAFTISNNTCGSSLAPNGSCTLGLSFAPTTSGSKSATLNFGGATDSITGTAQ